MRLAFYDEIELSGVGYMRFSDWQKQEAQLTLTSRLVLIDVVEVKTFYEAQKCVRLLSNVPVDDEELYSSYGPDWPLDCDACRTRYWMRNGACHLHHQGATS